MNNTDLIDYLSKGYNVVLSPAANVVILCEDGSVRNKQDQLVMPADSVRAAFYTTYKAKQEALMALADNTDLADMGVAAVQAASTAEALADLVTDFNALLTKLKAAGIMASA